MNTPSTRLTLSDSPQVSPERWGSSPDRLTRLLRAAIVRQDRAAELILRARIASVPWKPTDDTYPMFVWAGLRWSEAAA